MKKGALVLSAVLAVLGAGRLLVAAEVHTPSVLAFQSALYDDGGNPIADGTALVIFRISDAGGEVLYEERQGLEIVRGGVTALVGNGLTGSGAPTGGIPTSALEPGEARYLEAQVEGMPPTPLMEIASVPYALYADEALGVATGSIGFEDLRDGLIGELAAALADTKVGGNEVIVRSDLATMYRDPSSAAAIGVQPAFTYSSKNTLQGVLGDFDVSIKARDDQIAGEAAARQQADASEASARQTADAALQAQLNTAAPPNSFHVNAWCHVAQCTNGVSASCANASAEQAGVTRCRITFGQAMPDANYAAVTTPSTSVVSRDAGGITLDCSGIPNCAFDFIAVGR